MEEGQLGVRSGLVLVGRPREGGVAKGDGWLGKAGGGSAIWMERVCEGGVGGRCFVVKFGMCS